MNIIAWAKQEKRILLTLTEVHRFDSHAYQVIRSLAEAKVCSRSLYPGKELTPPQAAVTSCTAPHPAYCFSVLRATLDLQTGIL